MRWLLIVLLAGCGSHGSSGSSAPAAPDVTALSVIKVCGTADTCALAIKATYSDGAGTLTTPNTLVVEAVVGVDKPGPCTAASHTDGKDSVIIEGVAKPGIYYLRGCVFDGKTYTSGFTTTAVTP